MGCTNLIIPPSFECPKPDQSGNTYTIEIGTNDKIIVKLKHPVTGIEIISELRPAITTEMIGGNGSVRFKAEFFCRQISSEVKEKPS